VGIFFYEKSSKMAQSLLKIYDMIGEKFEILHYTKSAKNLSIPLIKRSAE
jgi:hypothetical protein